MATTLRLIAGDGGKEAIPLTRPLFLLANSRFNKRIKRTNMGNITLMAEIRPMLTIMLVSMLNNEVASLEVVSVICIEGNDSQELDDISGHAKLVYIGLYQRPWVHEVLDILLL